MLSGSSNKQSILPVLLNKKKVKLLIYNILFKVHLLLFLFLKSFKYVVFIFLLRFPIFTILHLI